MSSENEEDLVWFFQHAEAELGMQSNFGPIVSAIMSSGASRSSLPDNMTDGRLRAAGRYRIINERLRKLPAPTRDVLHAAFHPRKWSPLLTDKFGNAVGATPFSKEANEQFDADGGTDDRSWFQWLEGIVVRDERERITAIKRDADRVLAKAVAAYGGT